MQRPLELACMTILESIAVFLITGLAMGLMAMAMLSCDFYDAQNHRKQDESHYLYYYDSFAPMAYRQPCLKDYRSSKRRCAGSGHRGR
jgi:hypothetical protein